MSRISKVLTISEQRVFKEYVQGKTSVEVGLALGKSKRTVENQIANIYTKLGVNNKDELIQLAKKHGFIES